MSAHPVTEWVKKAEDNYISALTLMRRRTNLVPDVVCNQCQQCVEKYLKALLVRYAKTFPKTHDLIQLEDLASQFDPDVRLLHVYFDELNIYAIDVRYPGLAATVDDARNAIKATKTVRKFVRAKLGLKS